MLGWHRWFGREGLALLVLAAWLVAGLGPLGGPAGAAPRAAAASPLEQVAPLSPPAVVKVGLVPVTSAIGLYLAVDRGYFRDEGIEATFENFDSGAQMVPAIGTGQVDVGAGGAVSAGLFNAITRGIPLRLVATQSLVSPGHAIVVLTVRQDLSDSGAIRDYADLRGRRIAVPSRASIIEVVLDAALARGGMTVQDIDMVEISLPDIVAAYANRSIDAAIQTEPTATLSVERGQAVRWRSTDELTPDLLTAAYIYSPQFADGRPEVARRFMVALLRGVRDYVQAFDRGGDREPIIESMIRWTPLKDRPLYDRMVSPGVNPDGYIDIDGLQRDIGWYMRNGYVPEAVSAQSIVDHQFVDYAISRLGRFQ